MYKMTVFGRRTEYSLLRNQCGQKINNLLMRHKALDKANMVLSRA